MGEYRRHLIARQPGWWHHIIWSEAPPLLRLTKGLIIQDNWKTPVSLYQGADIFSFPPPPSPFLELLDFICAGNRNPLAFRVALCLYQTFVTQCKISCFNGLLASERLSVLSRRVGTANKQLPERFHQNVTSSWWRKISWKTLKCHCSLTPEEWDTMWYRGVHMKYWTYHSVKSNLNKQMEHITSFFQKGHQTSLTTEMYVTINWIIC